MCLSIKENRALPRVSSSEMIRIAIPARTEVLMSKHEIGKCREMNN